MESRDLCAQLIKMAWASESESHRSDWAILGDISPSGACLEIDEPIPVNAVVELEFGFDRCMAVVQYCKYDKVNYLLGVRFEPGYRWSSRRWEPKHRIQVNLHEIDKPYTLDAASLRFLKDSMPEVK